MRQRHVRPSRQTVGRTLWAKTALLLALSLAACSRPQGPQAHTPEPPSEETGLVPWSDAGAGTTPGAGQTALSFLKWTSAKNGSGPVELDKSNNTGAAADGKTLTIGGVSFSSGLGVHAASEIHYTIGGTCTAFSASVGVDDEVGGKGSVVFQVFGDGAQLYDSGTLTGKDAAKSVNVSVAGKNELKLIVADGGDGNSFDHADWANAKLSCAAPTPPPPPPPPSETDLTYTRIASQPYNVSEAQGEMVNGRLYTFGGFDGSKNCCTPTDRAYVYDPAANTWTPIANMPTHGVTHAGMTTDGTNIFYAGGYIADAAWTGQIFGTKAVWRYNVAANTYTRLPELPDERAAGQLEFLNGKLHYFGGTDRYEEPGLEGNEVSDHFVLDLAGGATSWTTAAPMPNPRHHMGSVVLGGKIYAVGGQHGHDDKLVTQKSVDVYDPATDTWTALPDLPRARSHMANSTFVLGGRIVVVGGETANDVPMSDVTAYDPDKKTWTPLTPLPMARASNVSAAFGDGFLITGGVSGGWVKDGWRAKLTSDAAVRP